MEYVILNYICKKILTDGGWIMNLPSAFEEKMRGLLQEEFDEYIACYEEPRYYGLRVNTAKITVEEFERICPFEITPIPWIENGFYYCLLYTSPSPRDKRQSRMPSSA